MGSPQQHSTEKGNVGAGEAFAAFAEAWTSVPSSHTGAAHRCSSGELTHPVSSGTCTHTCIPRDRHTHIHHNKNKSLKMWQMCLDMQITEKQTTYHRTYLRLNFRHVKESDQPTGSVSVTSMPLHSVIPCLPKFHVRVRTIKASRT